MKYALAAKSAIEARREAKQRWPNKPVKLAGYTKDGYSVYLSLVREAGNKANVATATRPGKATRFEAEVD